MQTGQAMDLERMILDTLAQDLDEHLGGPQLVDAALVERLQRLVAGVEIDLDQRLPPELGDAGIP